MGLQFYASNVYTFPQDIKRIAQSLSKVMKNPLPRIDVTSGKNPDINTLLSLVEDIIRQQNRAGDRFYTDDSKFTVTLEGYYTIVL